MLEWSLETIFSTDTLALEHSDVLKPSLAQLFKLGVYVGEQFVLLFFTESASSFTAHFWYSVHSPLHAIDLERATNILVQLGLPDFTEEEELSAMLLFVCIDPEE